MATPSQIAANIANSHHSTGPKSEAGKAASSRNRLSHGFASSATIIPGEDPEEFKALLADLTAEYQPATPTEQILVEKMTQNQWLSLRAFRLQSKLFVSQMSAYPGQFAIPKDLGLLIRYQTSAERAFRRAHTELVKTQRQRPNREIGFEPQNASRPADPPPAHPETGSKTVPITPIETASPIDRAAFPAQAAQSGWEICPEALEFIKNAARKRLFDVEPRPSTTRRARIVPAPSQPPARASPASRFGPLLLQILQRTAERRFGCVGGLRLYGQPA